MKRNFRLQKYKSTSTQAVLTLLQRGVTVINSLRLVSTLLPLCIHIDRPSTWLAQGMDPDCYRVQKASRPGSYWLMTFAWIFLKKKTKGRISPIQKQNWEMTQEVKSLFCKQKSRVQFPSMNVKSGTAVDTCTISTGKCVSRSLSRQSGRIEKFQVL